MAELLSGRGEGELNARVGPVNVFIEMCFNNAIVIQPNPFTEGILGDLEAAIDIPTEG